MKKLPLGISDFKKLIEDNRYFIDKSLFIKEIIDSDDQITLIPRPRRFGKTTNLSMLHYFYEAEMGQLRITNYELQNEKSSNKKDNKKKDNSHLFRDLKIWEAGDEYLAKCGNYPVIFITFKDVKSSSWEDCFKNIKIVISNEY